MDVNRILLDILVVLLAAKVAAELADRVNVPAVVGEIIAGVVVGPSLLGWVHESQSLQTLAQLGVILLLLEVGLEMDLGELASVGRASIGVAFVGVIIPLVTGSVAGLLLGMTGKEAVFVGAALTATSVGITARVFGDLRALASVEAKTVLGAAVADDVLGLVILTVVTRIVTEGHVSAFGVVKVVVVAVGFVVLASAIGVRIVPPTFAFIRRHSRSAGTLVTLALAFTLAISELAHAAELAPIVGAFVAGLALARSSAAERVRSELAPISHLLVPVFFLEIGIEVHAREFIRPSVFGIAGVLLVIAVIGKLASVIGLIGSPGDRILIGIGMIPRGEVGLIFAALGLRNNVFGQDIYAALLLVVLITTIGTPPALRWRLLALRESRRSARAATATTATTGPSEVHVGPNGLVELEGEPQPADALVIALRAARLCAEHAPGAGLLEWIDAFPSGPRRWDAAARDELFNLLRESAPRSWRLLTASGVLQRALPELDDALARSARSSLDLDPLASLSFPRLAALRDQRGTHGERTYDRSLLLAALVLDATDEAGVQPVVVARRTVQRLDLGAQIEQATAGLVADAQLLAAGARRIDGLDEEAVLRLGVHLGSVDQTDALAELTLASFPSDSTMRERVAVLRDLVTNAVAHQELVGREAANETERRKTDASALVRGQHMKDRIATAPRGYLLSQSPAAIARHVALCEPRPDRDDIRVAVTPVDGGFAVDVVARDRVGLLACTAAAFIDSECAVTQAVAATWGDGTALSTYRVEAAAEPDVNEVTTRIRSNLRAPRPAPPIEGVEFDYDNEVSPWYTTCTVVGPDRPGFLHALTAAFAAANVNVHAARVATEAGRARDSFDLTDRRGAKLDDATMAAVAGFVGAGTTPAPSRPGRRFRFPWSRAALALEL